VESLSNKTCCCWYGRMQLRHLHKNNHQLQIRESYTHDRGSVTTPQHNSEESIDRSQLPSRSELPSECTPSTGCNHRRQLLRGGR
jgi:hypothetical protein